MRTTTFFIAASLLTLSGLANAAVSVEPTPTDATDEPRTYQLVLPAGHMIQGRIVDGTFALEVVPATDDLPDGSVNTAAEGFAECRNDTPGYSYWDSWRLQWVVVPSVWPMNVALAPASNHASAGTCWNYDKFTGAPVYLSFQTAGTYGGAVKLNGYDALGYYGIFEIDCQPAGFGAATGAGALWLTTLQVQDAVCTVSQYGSQPGEFLEWRGEVHNYNTLTGESTWAWAY